MQYIASALLFLLRGPFDLNTSSRTCFEPLVVTKFRRCLDPHVNKLTDGPRRAKLKASGNLLVGFSGGLGSTVLLNILNRSYFHGAANATEKGGKSHPRNKPVWDKAFVCHVDVSGAFTEVSVIRVGQ